MSDLKTLTYPLVDGYIHNWLWLDVPLAPIQQRETPHENGVIIVNSIDHRWTYRRALPDHTLIGDGIAYVQLAVSAPIAIHNAPISQWGQPLNKNHTLTLDPGIHHLVAQLNDSVAIRVDGDPQAVTVHIPTTVERLDRREKYERVLDLATLDRDIYAGTTAIIITWDAQLNERLNVWAQLQHTSGRIYAEARKMIDPDDRTITLSQAHRLPTGDYHLLLTPQPDEYFHTLRYEHRIPFHVVNSKHSTTLYGDDATRRTEALRYAKDHAAPLFSLKAKLALGEITALDSDDVAPAISIARNGDPRTWVTLLGLADHLPESIHAQLQTISYTDDGLLSQVGSLLLHRTANETYLRKLLQQFCTHGFTFEDESFADTLIALVHLVDGEVSETLSDLAVVTLDKLLYTLALNTHQGTISSTLDVVGYPIPNGRTHPLSAVSRLLWGTGSWNEYLAAVVTLAASENYQVPSLIQAVALDIREMTSYEKQRSPSSVLHRTVYRTPDYALSSTEDRWEAVLNLDAVITVNAPANANAPIDWQHSGSAPQTAQHHDVIIARYHPAASSRMPFTRAYFPLWAFDEHGTQTNWWFARVGDGYLALTASQPLTLITTGATAHRELRAADGACVWFCHLGRAASDGTFTDFQTKILALKTQLALDAVTVTTLRGDQLRFAYPHPLMVNGERPHSSTLHYISPYSQTAFDSPTMDIHYGEYVMRLDFSVEEGKTS